MQFKRYILTVSYGDYTVGIGGTDKVILSQQKMFNENGISVLHISPLKNIGKIKLHINVWNVVEDGYEVGIYSTESIMNYLSFLTQQKHVLNAIVIHHLKNIDIVELKKVIDTNEAPIYFYLHDYMTICPSGGLVRNGQEFCGVYKISANNCKNCRFFSEKLIYKTELIENFFEGYINRLVFIAPSDSAKDVWANKYKSYSCKIIVIYHQELYGKYCEKLEEIGTNDTIKIAFVGYQQDLKGWKHWEKAVKCAIANKCNYRFYQFGRVIDHIPYVEEVHVDFKKNMYAMTEELRKNKIDVAVLWSTWPETYSYTYYEAFAANCFILTNKMSGNIAFQVESRHNGQIGENLDSLSSILLDSDELLKKINTFRRSKIYGPEFMKESNQILEMIGINEFYPEKISGISLFKESYILFCRILIKLQKARNELRYKDENDKR